MSLKRFIINSDLTCPYSQHSQLHVPNLTGCFKNAAINFANDYFERDLNRG